METFLDLLANYLFPITACAAMFWYMTVKDKNHKTEISELTQAHKEEIEKLDNRHNSTLDSLNATIADNTKAISQMTIVITQLSERLK